MRASADTIEAARALLPPEFRDSPQYVARGLGEGALRIVLKIETVNPVRSFKGRGASLLVAVLDADVPLVCASAGNFGQAMAYAAGGRVSVHVWVAADANPAKVERMRGFGAEVHRHDGDFDEAKEAAREVAGARGWHFVEDGSEPALAVGAGTIAVELDERQGADIEAIVVPVGNGSLVNGIGRWIKERRPHVRVIAAGALGAPAMERAWRSGRPEPAPARTVADGIGARVPVPEAVDEMRRVVDDFWLVSDDRLIATVRLLLASEGVLAEPAGAAALAAALANVDSLRGATVAIPICGSNVDPAKARRWLA
jgi:threonine dehydratase